MNNKNKPQLIQWFVNSVDEWMCNVIMQQNAMVEMWTWVIWYTINYVPCCWNVKQYFKLSKIPAFILMCIPTQKHSYEFLKKSWGFPKRTILSQFTQYCILNVLKGLSACNNEWIFSLSWAWEFFRAFWEFSGICWARDLFKVSKSCATNNLKYFQKKV